MQAHRQTTAIRRGAATLAAFPASLVGLGFFRSWVTLLTGAGFMAGLNGLVHDTALAAFLVAAALLAGETHPLFARRGVVLVCLAMALGASALTIAGSVAQAGLDWAGAGVAVLAACASGLFILMWSDLYSRLDATGTALALALAMLLAEAVGLLLAGMVEAYRLGALVVLPCLSILTLALARTHLPQAAPRPADAPSARQVTRIPWKLVALAGIYQFSSAACLRLSGASADLFSAGANVVSAGALLVGVLFFSERFDLGAICKSPAALLVPTLLLLPFAGGTHGVLAGALAALSSSLFGLLVFLVLCDVSRAHGVSAVLLFGIEEATTLFGVLGQVLGERGPQLAQMGVSTTALICVLVALTVLAGLTLFDGEALTRRWGVRILGPGKMSGNVRARERLAQACEAAGQAHGLTTRELEVLGLLAQERTSAEICAELNVAKGTFKAHCEHIYIKMGVRSRKELLQVLSQQVTG